MQNSDLVMVLRVLISTKKLTIPVQIGSRKYCLAAEVVKNEIPLIISKPVMKKLRSKKSDLDLKNDQWIIDGEKIKLQCTTSGHYCLPLNMFHVDCDDCYITLTISKIKNLSKDDKMKKTLKLHRQFGHASELKLKKLVKESDMNDKEFLACIGDVCKTCNICVAYKAASLKPVVSLPLANKFNQVVCLDLKECVHNKV